MDMYHEEEDEDDFIDMEVGPSNSNLLSHSAPYHHHQNQIPREFEFHMSSNSIESVSSTSPADELFYNGKLLPLYPPQLQMVNSNILHFSIPDSNNELYSTPLLTSTTPTPFESCNASPSESCRVSKELDPEEHLVDTSRKDVKDPNFSLLKEDSSGGGGDYHGSKKSWTRKIRLITQSSLSSKLKASGIGAYLKSLFGKSDQSKGAIDESGPKANEQNSGFVQRSCKKVDNNINGSHRRSFSVSIKRHSSNKIPSSSPSPKDPSKKSDALNGVQLLKRSSSVNSGTESPIQRAIAHCKRSHHHFFSSRKALCEVGFQSFSASRLSISEDQDKLSSLCRG